MFVQSYPCLLAGRDGALDGFQRISVGILHFYPPVISHKLEAHLSATGTQRNSVRRLILRPSSESLEVLGWDSPWPWTVKRSL